MLLRVVVLWRRLVQALSSNSVLRVLSSNNKAGADDVTDHDEAIEEEENPEFWKSPLFDSEKQVRVILFQESDLNGRKVLFDSRSLREKDNKEINAALLKRKKKAHSLSTTEQININVEKLKRNSLKISNDDIIKNDIDLHMLEEMVFGSVGMTYSGTTMKIHTVRSPPHLIISLVFPAPVPNENKNNREKELEESGSWHHSSNEIQISKCTDNLSSVAHSIPVDVPGGLSLSNHYNHYGSRYISSSLQSTGSTRSCHSLSPISPNSVSSSLNCSGSFNSLQRRLLRNMATSIEFGLHPKSEEGSPIEESKEDGQRKMKLGLSIVISLDENNPEESSQFHEFFFSHVTIIEGHVLRLKNSISKAYLNRKMSVVLTCEGIKKFHRSLQDLYTAPRLSCPFWLTRMLPEMNHHRLCYKFINQFVLLLDKYERKETNFFVSTLLSAVLTHHLAWVPTVTPSDVLAEEIGNHNNVVQWLEMLAKSHPYNPLWMQLGDMYGCLGFPNKLARTIVTGTNCDTIDNFLFILSYFIRCSGIWEHVFEKSIITTENLAPLSTKDIGLETVEPEIIPNVTEDKRRRMFSGSYLPKRKYSLQQDFNKWMQNTQKNFNLSLENEYDQYNSKETNWKHYQSKYDFKTECDVQPHNFDVYMLNNCSQNNNEDTVFSLDENLLYDNSFIDNFSNNKIGPLPKSNLHKPESFMDSLGYSSMDDQQDDKQLTKQSWNQNSQSKNSNLSIANINSYNYEEEEEHEFIPIVTLEKADFNETRNCLKLHDYKLYSCQTNLKSNHDTNCNGYGDSVTKMKHSDRNTDLEKWHKSRSNAMSKTSDDGPEEGYHSMEETKITVSNHKKCLSENKNMLKKMTELQLPKFQIKEVQTGPSLYRGYGWSLLASISNHYMTDFCLQGIKGNVKEEEVRDDLLTAIEFPVLGEPITEAVGIIADTDKWKVKLVSTNRMSGDIEGSPGIQVGMSSLVADVCESILQMHKFSMPPELCMMHLEDRLQELYFRSRFLAEYLSNESSQLSLNRAATLLGLNLSDINLLVAVGTTHTPQLATFNR